MGLADVVTKEYMRESYDFKKFASSLREVLNYIKYSKDENELTRLLAEDERLKAEEAGLSCEAFARKMESEKS